jgi:hypothetical protein
MSELSYFRNHCESCGGGIEFPANGVGEEVTCPHCQRLVTLAFPTGSDSDAPKQIETYLSASSFPSKNAELLLLSNFTFPRERNELRGLEIWENALNSEPNSVVNRFVAAGFLREGNVDVVRLLQSKSSSDLKTLAKERNVGHSGTKEVLAKRLAKADPEGMKRLFHGKVYVTCTPKGQLVANKFLDSEKQIKSEAERESALALKQGRFKEACLLVAAFEASRVFPRGVGIDWKRYDYSYDLSVLDLIFKQQLKRLVSLDQNTLLNLRLAGMMQLWGTNRPPRWLLSDSEDWSIESRMILFSAIGTIRLQGMKKADIRRVQVLSSGHPDICPACRSSENKTYKIEDAPILPHEKCECEAGCCFMLIGAE